jgi:Ca2+-dependent lipid-binding protein
MDPFVVLEYRGLKYKTNVIDEGGQNPIWNQTFDIPIYNNDKKLVISCYDEDYLINDNVGSMTLDVTNLCDEVGHREWVKLMFE